MDRDDRREAILCDEADRQWFVETLGEACAKTGWRVPAYVLLGAHHYGAELQEGEEEKAERVVQEELARQGWSEQDLGEWAKTDHRKARLERRLRAETTMTLVWVAHRLQMGSVNTLKNTLRLANGRD